MRSLVNFLPSFLILISITACIKVNSSAPNIPTILPTTSTIEKTDIEMFGAFEGITPCNSLTTSLPQIPKDSDCEQMIWKIVLFHDAVSGMPATYELNSAYGLSQPNSNGLADGGTQVAMIGYWEIIKGNTTYPHAIIYRLNSDQPRASVSLIKIGDDVLHILSEDGALLVGHGAWSYTLNRTDTHPYQAISNPGSAPIAKTPLVTPSPSSDSSVLGVFEGRTPCHEIVFKMIDVQAYERCLKIKLKLTLYQDGTGAPDTYTLQGTSTIQTGIWKITRGMKTNGDAIIYQLYSAASQNPVSLLKVDDNHLFLLDQNTNLLVGNALFSYTLSRTN
jgi:hypothetical protein